MVNAMNLFLDNDTGWACCDPLTGQINDFLGPVGWDDRSGSRVPSADLFLGLVYKQTCDSLAWMLTDVSEQSLWTCNWWRCPTLFPVCQILIAPACNVKIGWQILMTISSRPMSKTCKTHGPWSVSRPAACSPKPFLGPWTRRSGSIRAVMCFAPVWGFTFFQPATFWHRVSYGPFKLQPSKLIWVQGTTTCLTFGYGFQFFKSNCEVTAKVICVRHSPQNVYFA